MRKFFIVFLCVVSLICLMPNSFAASYTAYGSVTGSTSQISNLVESMFNQPDFNPFMDWIGIRAGEYEYDVFYNIKDGHARRLRYYGQSSGYQTIWYYQILDEVNFSYTKGNYTITGNTVDALGSSAYRSYLHNYIFKLTVPFILILFIFFIFRVRKRGRGVNL